MKTLAAIWMQQDTHVDKFAISEHSVIINCQPLSTNDTRLLRNYCTKKCFKNPQHLCLAADLCCCVFTLHSVLLHSQEPNSRCIDSAFTPALFSLVEMNSSEFPPFSVVCLCRCECNSCTRCAPEVTKQATETWLKEVVSVRIPYQLCGCGAVRFWWERDPTSDHANCRKYCTFFD